MEVNLRLRVLKPARQTRALSGRARSETRSQHRLLAHEGVNEPVKRGDHFAGKIKAGQGLFGKPFMWARANIVALEYHIE